MPFFGKVAVLELQKFMDFLDIFNTKDWSAVGGLKFFNENNSAERQLQFVQEVQSIAKRVNKELGLPPNSHAKLAKELLEGKPVDRKPIERKLVERKQVEQRKSGKLTKKERKAAAREKKINEKNRQRAEPRVSLRLKEKVQKELPTSFKIYDVETNKIEEISILGEEKPAAKIPIETLRNEVQKLRDEVALERPKKLSEQMERKNFFAASRNQYAQERQQFFIDFRRENGRPAEMSEWVAHHACINQKD